MCLSTKEHLELRASYVYFIEGTLSKYPFCKCMDTYTHYDQDHMERVVGVYNLKDGMVEDMPELGKHNKSGSVPPLVWFTPCTS
ncbi:hypothetical protein ABZP36_004218 [Zizania latifolia]